MRKISGVVLILLAALLSFEACRFFMAIYAANSARSSARTLVIYVALVIIGLYYLLRAAFRLLK